MSLEAINDFFKDFDNKPELAGEFDAIVPGDDYKQKVVELGAKHGYEFTLEELEAVVATAKRLKEQAQ